MPLPFIIGGVIAAAAAVTAKKGYDGYKDSSRADEIIESAERRQGKAKDDLNAIENAFHNKLADLGKLRLDIAEDINSLENMTKELQRIFKDHNMGKVDVNIKIPSMTLERISSFTATAMKISSGAFSGVATGAAAGYAIYGGVMALGAASTGTAISTLSGVAATNAALAAIGGGSLAAGGLGIAGGTALLSGVVAAPILAIASWKYASNAEEKLYKAFDFSDDVDKAIVNMKEAGKGLDKLKDNIIGLIDATNEFRKLFNPYYNHLKNILADVKKAKSEGKSFGITNKEAGVIITNAISSAGILTDICTLPPFKMDGNTPIKKNGLPVYNDKEINDTDKECKDRFGELKN